MSLSCLNYPGVICHLLPKTFLLLNRKPAVVSAIQGHGNCDSKLCLIQSSFLPPNQGIPLHRLLLPRLVLFFSQDVELKETLVFTLSSPSSAT